MLKKGNVSNVETIERRAHWRDRREGSDRRNAARLCLNNTDCRSGQPRRSADVTGELSDGDVWWNKDQPRYE